jgi:fructokinase
MTELYGGIEAGGTKFVCAVGTGPDDLIIQTFATTSPQQTLALVIQFFKQYDLAAIGIGSFGPIDLDKHSVTYGYITSTPKQGWEQFDFVGALTKAFAIPIGFDTDVNAAALGENKWGAAQGLTDFIYLTVGTGIGGGAMVNGQLIHGLMHPEMGHILIQQHPCDDFDGICPFHKNRCLEGLASGPAIEKSWGKPANELHSEHIAWEIEADYLAQALVNYMCILSPQKIILGGGVMNQRHLLDKISEKVQQKINAYIALPNLTDFIVLPELADKAGVLGALALAINGRSASINE